MTGDPPTSDRPKRDVPLPSGYESVYDQQGRQIRGSPAAIDWKVPVVASVLAILVGVGVGIAIYEAEPLEGWLDLRQVKLNSNEGYFYLLIETAGAGDEPPWEDVSYAIAIDTYDRSRGVQKLADGWDVQLGSGAEFLLEINGPAAATLRVADGYDPIGNVPPVASPRKGSGFRNMTLTANRQRYTRDGTRIPEIVVDRGVLEAGSEDPAAADFSTLTDFSIKDGAIEIRIPWGLLNVGDPSTRRVLHADPAGGQPGPHVVTDGFRVYVLTRAGAAGKVSDSIPDTGKLAPLYRWPTWEEPAFRIEPKHGLGELKLSLDALPDSPSKAPGGPPGADEREADGSASVPEG